MLGFYDVFGGNADSAMKWAVEAPARAPLMIIPVLAAAPENLALGVTVTTSYEHPFTHARRLSTLDHLTNGRVGWNMLWLLTSLAKSMPRAIACDRSTILASTTGWSGRI